VPDFDLSRLFESLHSIKRREHWPALTNVPRRHRPPTSGWPRIASAVAALAIAVAGIGFAAIAFRGDLLDGRTPAASEDSPTPETTTWSPGPATSCVVMRQGVRNADTEVGQWFLRLLFDVGAPEGWPVAPEHISEKYEAFFIDIPQHVGRFDMYAYVDEPDLVNFPDGLRSPVLARSSDYVLHGDRFGEEPPLSEGIQHFSVVHPRVWITLHVVPTNAGAEMDDDPMIEWFHRLVAATEDLPPPACLARLAQ
jgi:hypothetical protein